MCEEKSKKYKLNKEDGLKILRGAMIAFGGCALTFATDMIPLVDWGDYSTIVVALSGVLINFGWKIWRGQK